VPAGRRCDALREPVRDALRAILRSLRRVTRCHGAYVARPGALWNWKPLIERRPTMKKLMILLVFGALLAGTTGCHVAECWRYAWNSRFHPERNAPPAQPCVIADPCCDPCADPCGAPMVVPGR
jgi:hypothetical protein